MQVFPTSRISVFLDDSEVFQIVFQKEGVNLLNLNSLPTRTKTASTWRSSVRSVYSHTGRGNPWPRHSILFLGLVETFQQPVALWNRPLTASIILAKSTGDILQSPGSPVARAMYPGIESQLVLMAPSSRAIFPELLRLARSLPGTWRLLNAGHERDLLIASLVSGSFFCTINISCWIKSKSSQKALVQAL